MQLFISDKIKVADTQMRTEMNWAIYYHGLHLVCSFIVSLPPSLCLPSLSLSLSRAFALVFSLTFLGAFRVFRFRNSCSALLYLLCENEIVFAPQVNRERTEMPKRNRETERERGKKLRKVDSANAANGSRNAASQIDRQIWRSSRSSCVEGLQEQNKIQIVPVKERNERKKCKQDTNVQK